MEKYGATLHFLSTLVVDSNGKVVSWSSPPLGDSELGASLLEWPMQSCVVMVMLNFARHVVPCSRNLLAVQMYG
jgi:hypothetical protein